jgi:hypothetical protein
VVKLSTMSPDMQEFAIQCATDAIAAKNTEQVRTRHKRGR